jgi:hypothetical protein
MRSKDDTELNLKRFNRAGRGLCELFIQAFIQRERERERLRRLRRITRQVA